MTTIPPELTNIIQSYIGNKEMYVIVCIGSKIEYVSVIVLDIVDKFGIVEWIDKLKCNPFNPSADYGWTNATFYCPTNDTPDKYKFKSFSEQCYKHYAYGCKTEYAIVQKENCTIHEILSKFRVY